MCVVALQLVKSQKFLRFCGVFQASLSKVLLPQYFLGTQVFLNGGGAVQVKQQQFPLDILILNARCKVNQRPDVFVSGFISFAEGLAVPAFQ